MRSLHTTGVFKALLLAGCAGTFALAAPAAAQDDPEGAEGDDSQIVVTGSRITRPDYVANSPTVTVDEALLKQSATAALEVNLNKLPQFTPAQTPTLGGDIQPTATNTPGAATISLRGIGSNRNLVLLDGRRSTPSNASGVTDISTIPSAAIERIEIISGGASATYGADAIAGVTNFILKKNFQGLELDGQLGLTQEGDGFEYQVSGIMGTDFPDGRGNISLALSVNTREASYQRDRKWYRDLWADPNIAGTQFFLDRPGVNLNAYTINPATIAALFPDADPAVPNTFLTVFTNPDGTVWTGNTFASRGGLYRFDGSTAPGSQYKIDATGTLGQNNTNMYLILPLTRYNAFARGNYEINDWIGVFGQAMFSHVETYTRNEPGPITTGWDVQIPYGSGIYTGDTARNIPSSLNPDGTTNAAYLPGGQYGLNCGPTGGCTNTEVFPLPAELQQVLLNRTRPARPGEPGYIDGAPPFLQPLVSGANDPFAVQSLLKDDRETFTDVMTYNITAGLEGSVPGTDWTWEAFVNHGISATSARQTGIYSLMRMRAVMSAPNFGRGFSLQGNQASGGFGASTGTCTSGLNFYDESTPFTEDCLEAVRADLKNRSEMRQTIVEANLQGGLFDLPAGQLRFAIGASYRELDYEFINDTLTTQGRSFLDQALGIYPSGDAFGFIDTKELYGELLIPILADIPFIQEFNLEVGGRMSNYSTTGTSYTYKILGDWAVNDWLRFRGGFNRAERAPNIGELFLAAQQTFGVNTAGDPCSLANPLPWSANPANANGANVQAVCRILMQQSGNPTADAQYYNGVQSASTFGFAFPTLVGNPNLTPEKANTWTAGVVVQSPFSGGALSRLRLSVDWFDIKVTDAIGAQTVAAALQQCFDPSLNPLVSSDPTAAANTQFCQNVPRTQTGNTGNIFTTYTNNGRFHVQGIDAQLDWGIDVGPGTFNLNLVGNYLIDFKSAALPTLPLVDYVGTFGTGENGLTAGGAYRYRITTNVGYTIGAARIGLLWQHWPSYEDSAEASSGVPTDTTGGPAYDLFSLNGSYQMTDDIGLRFGIDNLFNRAPPRTGENPAADVTAGQLVGGMFQGGVYDTNGRRFYVGANIRF